VSGGQHIEALTRQACERWNARDVEGLLELFEEEVESVEERGDWGFATVVQRVRGGSSGVPTPFTYYGIGHWRSSRLAFVETTWTAIAPGRCFAATRRGPPRSASPWASLGGGRGGA
jgi:hypothetical protein